jgi:hypothetical protein
VDLGDGLSGTVQFDVPDLAGAARLARRLRPYWAVSVQERNEVALVSVGLLAETNVAQLLRAAEAWVAEESLRAIRFELDGRWYVLEAGEADWTAAA